MAVFKDLLAFLTQKDVLAVAVGLIISNSVLQLTKSFTDDLVLPAMDPAMKTLGADKLGALELKVLGAKLRLGRFIQTLIRFVVLMITVMLMRKWLGRKK